MSLTKTNHWKLGLFVIIGMATGVASIFALGARHLNREAIECVSYFDESVQGLDVGSPVKFRGVTIGNVLEISIASDKRHVRVQCAFYVDVLETFDFNPGEAPGGSLAEGIDSGMRIQLASAGITGLKFLQVDFFDPLRYPVVEIPFEPEDAHIPSAPSTLKSLEDGLSSVLNELPSLVIQLRSLAENVNTTLDDMDLASLSARLGEFMRTAEEVVQSMTDEELAKRTGDMVDSIRELSGAVGEVLDSVGDKNGEANMALAAWRQLAEEAQLSLRGADLQATAASLREASSSVVGVSMSANSTMVDLDQALSMLAETLESLRALASYLERDPGALLRGRASSGQKGEWK